MGGDYSFWRNRGCCRRDQEYQSAYQRNSPRGLQEDQYNIGSANRDQHGPKSFLFMFTRSCNQCSPSGFLGEAGFRLGLPSISEGGLAGVGRYQGTPGRPHRRSSVTQEASSDIHLMPGRRVD